MVRDLDSPPFLAICLAGIAGVLTARAEPESAARLLSVSASAWRGEATAEYYQPLFHAAYEPAQAATRAALDAETYARARKEGETLSLERATALALELLAPAAVATGGSGA